MEALAVLGAAWPRLMESVHGRRLADGTSHGDVSGVRGEDWSSVISAVWIALGMLPLLDVREVSWTHVGRALPTSLSCVLVHAHTSSAFRPPVTTTTTQRPHTSTRSRGESWLARPRQACTKIKRDRLATAEGPPDSRGAGP